jgi:hypothetical protein
MNENHLLLMRQIEPISERMILRHFWHFWKKCTYRLSITEEDKQSDQISDVVSVSINKTKIFYDELPLETPLSSYTIFVLRNVATPSFQWEYTSSKFHCEGYKMHDSVAA